MVGVYADFGSFKKWMRMMEDRRKTAKEEY
jgi:hypothetical protein